MVKTKTFFSISAIIFMIGFLSLFNRANILENYGTEESIISFIFRDHFIWTTLGMLAVSMFIGILTLGVDLAWPNFFNAFKKENRHIYLKDGFISLLATMGIFSIIQVINTLL